MKKAHRTGQRKIEQARSTCNGLHRLVRQLNGAAVDVDKGGASTHDLLALLATTNDCINTLSGQLDDLEHYDDSNTVPQLKRAASR